MKPSPTRVLAVIGTAIVLIIGGAVAYAQIPSANGTITACVTQPSGTMRLIDAEAGATCKKGETLVTWNQAGQAGTDGSDGVSGYQLISVPGSGQGDGFRVAFVEHVTCPAGSVMLGLSGDASVIGNVSARAEIQQSWIEHDPADDTYTGIFVFAKIDGSVFSVSEGLNWRAQATCAAVAS